MCGVGLGNLKMLLYRPTGLNSVFSKNIYQKYSAVYAFLFLKKYLANVDRDLPFACE